MSMVHYLGDEHGIFVACCNQGDAFYLPNGSQGACRLCGRMFWAERDTLRIDTSPHRPADMTDLRFVPPVRSG